MGWWEEALSCVLQVHQHAAPPPTVVVDLVAEEQQAGQQQQQPHQQLRGQAPALKGMSAAVPGLTLTPGGSLPFTPSLLRTAEQQRYAAMQPAETEPPFTTSLLRRDEELRRKEGECCREGKMCCPGSAL